MRLRHCFFSLGVLLVLVCVLGVAGNAWATTAYVANAGSGTVTPIEVATNKPGPEITVGSSPAGVAITPDGKTAYIANFGGVTVTPIEVATNEPGPEITVGSGPVWVAITPDGKTAYIATESSGLGALRPIEVATNKAGSAIIVGSEPFGVAITPDGKTAYLTNYNSGTVTPFEVATNTPGPEITVGSGPLGVAITPDGKTAYVANERSGTVTPIEVATNKPGPEITVGSDPHGVAITPDGKTVYVTNRVSGTVTPIEVATNEPGPEITVGSEPFGIAITPAAATEPTTTHSIPSGTIAVGQSETDEVLVTGSATLGAPIGNVSFFVCAKGTEPCASGGTAVGGSVGLTPSSSDESAATSGSFTPSEGPGTYCFRAEYEGGGEYLASSDASTGECFAVGKATPTVKSTPSGSIAAGGKESDGVTVTGNSVGKNPSGSVKFLVCAEGISPCASGGIRFGSTVALSAGAGDESSATSERFTPREGPGTYCMRAEYEGDSNYSTASDATGSECFTVVRARCTANSGTVKLSPGLTRTPAVQTMKIKGTLSGCTGDAFTAVAYKATLKTAAPVSCSVLSAAGETATGSAKYKWTPSTKASGGTLSLLLTETPGVAFSGKVTSGSYSPLAFSGTATESYSRAATCSTKAVKKGTFSGSAVNFE